MALKKACDSSVVDANTGVECDEAMLASAMIYLAPVDAEWDDDDIEDFTDFLKDKIHAPAAERWFPLFGTSAPIRNIVDNKESDVVETMEDGSQQFVRYGMYNRTFLTDKGGLCLAQAMMGLGKNKGFIEVDIAGKVLNRVSADGTKYSPVPLNLGIAATPDLATLKTVYKNAFMMSFSPNDYIKRGTIFASDEDEDILSLRGLLDTEVVAGEATQTTTNIFVGVRTLCAGTDLVEKYDATLAATGNFIVKKVSDGSTVSISAASVVNGEVRLTGTFISAAQYTVELSAAATLLAAGIEGYEGTKKATVTIP